MSEAVNVTEADKAIEDRIYRERGRFPHGHLAARHRIEATRQAEADKAELVAQIRADRDTFRDCDIIDDPIGAAAQLEAAMRNCDALLEKHGGRDG